MADCECTKERQLKRIEDDIRRLDDNVDDKVAKVYEKYNGKIGELIKAVSALEKALAVSSMKIALIIGVGSFVASLAFTALGAFIKEAIHKAVGG
jgi:hypothetical protein